MRRHPLAAFFVLACGFSWAYWVPLALVAPQVSHFPGLLGPLLAAVVVTATVDGRGGLRTLLRRAVRWQVPLRWYAAALAPAAAGAVTLVALTAAGRGRPSWPELGTMPGVPDVGLAGLLVVLLLVNGYGEEVGWRGFAWPRLRRRHGLVASSLLLAAPWALWHLPTFWLETGLADLDLRTVPGWLIALPFGALVLGWLYERSGRSLLVVALFHAALNWASATEATAGLPAVVVSALVVVAACVIAGRGQRVPPPATDPTDEPGVPFAR